MGLKHEQPDYLESIADAIGMDLNCYPTSLVITGSMSKPLTLLSIDDTPPEAPGVVKPSFCVVSEPSPRVLSSVNDPDTCTAIVMLHVAGDLLALAFNNSADDQECVDMLFFTGEFGQLADIHSRTGNIQETISLAAPNPVLYVRRINEEWRLIDDQGAAGATRDVEILDVGQPKIDQSDAGSGAPKLPA